eukprot:6315675-Prorocentrum_lima.AAC.1
MTKMQKQLRVMQYMRSLAPKDTKRFKEWQRSLSKYEWQRPDKQIIKTNLPFTAKDMGEESFQRLQEE